MTATNERTLVSFDWAMKNILREKANFDVLEGFLSTLLNEEIRVLSLLESEANQQHDLDKYNRVDLLAVDANAQILIIELQYTWQPSYLKRILYGTAKLIVENIKVGESFDNVRKVISISILYFPVSQADDDYLYHGKTEFVGMNNGKALQVNMAKLPKPEKTDKASAVVGQETNEPSNIFPEYYLIEVEHFQNIIRQPIDEWVYLFKNSQVRDDFHSKNIQAAKEKLTVLHMSEAERKAYEQFQISRASAMDVLAGQYQEGIEFANRENARKMRIEGLSPALISKITGLSEAEIAAL
ncbi:MAG: Rpn family recombination-promoting nuclease/putative transposase [Caldilineaceae bacterium]